MANPDTLSERRFPVYFDGSELVVAGKLYEDPPSNNLRGVIDSTSTDGPGQNRLTTDIRVCWGEAMWTMSFIPCRVLQSGRKMCLLGFMSIGCYVKSHR